MFAILSIICLAISAGSWFYAGKSVSREAELARRERILRKRGEAIEDHLGGVNLIDDGKSYDLIGTLRHQTQWNRAGAIFAAVGLILQTVPQLIQ